MHEGFTWGLIRMMQMYYMWNMFICPISTQISDRCNLSNILPLWREKEGRECVKPLLLFFLKLIMMKSVCVLCLINVCQPWQKEGHAGNRKAASLALHEHIFTAYATNNYTQQPRTVLTIKEPVNRSTQITADCSGPASLIEALWELQDTSYEHQMAS